MAYLCAERNADFIFDATAQMCKFAERKLDMFLRLRSNSALTSFSLVWTKARSAVCYVTFLSSYVAAPTAPVWSVLRRLLGPCQGPFFGCMIRQKKLLFSNVPTGNFLNWMQLNTDVLMFILKVSYYSHVHFCCVLLQYWLWAFWACSPLCSIQFCSVFTEFLWILERHSMPD